MNLISSSDSLAVPQATRLRSYWMEGPLVDTQWSTVAQMGVALCKQMTSTSAGRPAMPEEKSQEEESHALAA
jgi:hypothetical protein